MSRSPLYHSYEIHREKTCKFCDNEIKHKELCIVCGLYPDDKPMYTPAVTKRCGSCNEYKYVDDRSNFDPKRCVDCDDYSNWTPRTPEEWEK